MHGGDIYTNKIEYDFSVNLNPFAPNENIVRAVYDAVRNITVYPEYKSKSLRDCLAKKHMLDAEMICMSNGASEAISEVFNLPGINKILLETPSFYGYEHGIKNHQSIKEYSRKELIEICEKEISEDSLIIIANPANPTGECSSSSDIIYLYEKIKKAGALMMLDESFLPLSDYYNESFIKVIGNNPEFYDRILIVRSFTKSFSIPGIRLGYLVSSNKEAIKIIENRFPEWNVSSIAQVVGKECLKYIDELNSAAISIKEMREYLSKELNELGFYTYKSCANYILFTAPEYLYDELILQKILIRDCSDYRGINRIFEENMANNSGIFRVAVKTKNENVILVNAIKKILENKN